MSFSFAVNQAVLAHVFKVKAGDIGPLFLSPLFFIILIIFRGLRRKMLDSFLREKRTLLLKRILGIEISKTL